VSIEATTWPIVAAIATCASSIGAIVFGAFALRKTLHETPTFFHHRMREEHKFAREFLRELKADPQMHPHARTTGFHAIAGNSHDDTKLIEYLISLEFPARPLRQYSRGRSFLRHDPQDIAQQVKFKPKYESPQVRKRMRWWRAGWFFLFNFTWPLPLLLPTVASMFKLNAAQVLAALAPALLLYEIVTIGGFVISLNAVSKLSSAERLVKEQSSHPAVPCLMQ
jgi:hypothetical protein